MPVDTGLATLSDNLLFAAVVGYFVAMLGYAAEYAFRRRASEEADAAVVEEAEATVAATVAAGVAEGALVGGRSGVAVLPDAPPPPAPARGPGGVLDLGDVTSADASAGRARRERGRRRAAAVARLQRDSSGPAARVGRVAVAVTLIAWGLHIASVTTRGLSAHRVPWGNMYEFSSMVALVAVTAFLVLLTRQPVRYLGAFVMLPVVLYLGLAAKVLYAPAGPLVPALNSYWIKIHVAAAISATGIFMVGAAVTLLYLLRQRYDRRHAAGKLTSFGKVAQALPSAEALDRTAYRVIAFAFPVWTFAIIAGAIWAEAAWGRYWGWDPKETWSFITWVIYAGYLHARATGGWRGRRAAVIALIGFSALVVDYYVVNIFVSGLHSYAGL